MVLSNVIVDITISSPSFVLSQSDVQISAGLTNISGLAVAAFDFINCSPSVESYNPTTSALLTNLSLLYDTY